MLALTAAATVAMNAKQNVLGPRERFEPSGEAVDEPGPDHGFERVSGRDAERRHHRARGRDVDEEGADRIAGQTQEPKRSAAAIAIPVGGQTALALAWIEASSRPSFPARK